MINKLITSFILLFIISINCKCQWASIGPYGGPVSALIAIEDTLFAGSKNGIFKSNNNGEKWFKESIGITVDYEVYKFLKSDSGVYAATSQGLFEYSFKNKKWKLIYNSPIKDFTYTKNGSTLYIYVTNGTTFSQSINNGAFVQTTWPNSILAPDSILSTGLWKNNIFISTDKGIFRKTLTGTWLSIDLGIKGSHIPYERASRSDINKKFDFVIKNDTLFTLSYIVNFWMGLPIAYNDIYYYDTIGSKWIMTSSLNSFLNTNIKEIFSANGFLYASSNFYKNGDGNPTVDKGQLYRSSNNGLSWTLLPSVFKSSAGNKSYTVNCFTFNNKFLFNSNDEKGIQRLLNTSLNWENINSGLNNISIKKLIKADSFLLSVPASGDLQLSTNQGTNWLNIHKLSTSQRDERSTIVNTTMDAIYFNDTLYVAGFLGVYRKSSQDSLWTSFNTSQYNPFIFSSQIHKFLHHENQLYGLNQTNVFIKKGAKWLPFIEATSISAKSNFKLIDFTIAPDLSQFLALDSVLYTRKNDLTPWVNVPLPNKKIDITSIFFHDNHLFIISNKSMYSSTVNGKTFTEINLNPKVISDLSSIVPKKGVSIGKDIFLLVNSSSNIPSRSTPTKIIYRSADSGKSWKALNQTLPTDDVFLDIIADNDYIYGATNGTSVWKYPIARFHPPVASSGTADSITGSTANMRGTASANGYSSTAILEYTTSSTFSGSVISDTVTSLVTKDNTPIKITIKHLNDSTTYYYRWRIVNSGGIDSIGAIGTFTTKSFLKIDHLKSVQMFKVKAYADSTAGNKVSFKTSPLVGIVLNHPIPGAEVKLKYRNFTNLDWKDTLVKSSTSIFKIQLPPSAFDAIGLEYRFVMDPPEAYASKVLSDTITPVTRVPITFAHGLAVPQKLQTGASSKDYNMISFPLTLADSRPGAILYKAIGVDRPDDTKYRFLTYVGPQGNGNYKNIWNINPEAIVPGTGYWFAARNIKNKLRTDSAKTIADHANFNGENFKIALRKGYNQIGNPFLFKIFWKDIAAATNNSNVNSLIGFVKINDTLGLQKIDALEPFQAAYILNSGLTNIDLVIPAKATTSLLRIANDEPENFQVNFTIATKALRTSLTSLGTNPEAKEGFDIWDEVNPQIMGDFPGLKFEDHDSLMTNITSENIHGNVWKMNTTEISSNQNCKLSWKVSNNDPLKQLWLHDVSNESIINMDLKKEYNFIGNKKFKVYYGSETYVRHVLNPEKTTLKIYPSPVEDKAIVAFTMLNSASSTSYQIKISLLDLSGKTLEVIEEKGIQSGFYETLLHFSNSYSGLKIIQLDVSDSNGRINYYYSKIAFK